MLITALAIIIIFHFSSLFSLKIYNYIVTTSNDNNKDMQGGIYPILLLMYAIILKYQLVIIITVNSS